MTGHKYLLLLVGVLMGCAETVLAVEQEIQPASLNAPVVPTSIAKPAQVTFGQQPAQAGDRVAQTIGTELQLTSQITQAGQPANQSQALIKRQQQRFVEVLEVAGGRVRRAKVIYPRSRLAISQNEAPEQETVQPVETKSYFVTRQGESLLVTDAEGAIPSKAEYEIVVTSLKNLGMPNPLIDFLVGRTVQVGERLVLPPEVARQAMDLGDQFNNVEQFELHLKAIEEIDGQPCAVFATTIEAVGEPANPIKIRAFGQIVVQTQTCRTVKAELSGPLALSTVERTAAGNFEHSVQGSVRMAIQAKYGYAQQ